MEKFNFMDWLSGVLLAVGGINWGLIGFFKYDLLAKLLTDGSGAYRFVTAVVGLAAVYAIGAVVYYSTTFYRSHHAHA